ncbi:MAG: MDR family MFS transporter [Denitrobacterium sp.]|nr:MDR family MFS transporter [Denitrobacterium sp.]
MGLTKQQKMMIAVLLSGTLLVVLNATFLSPALPHIMRDTGVDATTVQWLTSAYSMVEAVIIPLNAFFIGRFSTRKLFIGGIAWFAVASVVAALAPNFGILLLARVMMAMATGIIMPMVFTLILLIFPRESRGSAMGIVGLIISFAPAIGPSLSGVLVDGVGWRMLFVIVAVIAAIVVIFASVSLKNFSGFERVPFDAPSVALLLSGMLSLLYGISNATTAANPVEPAALIAAGLVLLGLFARRQTKLDVPLLRVQVLKSRRFRTAVILIALMQAALIGSEVVLPLYVQQVMGNTATVSGLLMLPGAVFGAVSGLIAGRLFDRKGVRGVVMFGATLLAIGAVGVTTFNMGMDIIMVTVVYSIMAIGIQFLITPINTWGVNSLDNQVVQHGNALASTTNQVGASFGTAFIVSLTALGSAFAPAGADATTVTFTGVHIAFVGMCAVLLIVAAGIFLFVRDTPKERAEAEEKKAERETLCRTGVPGIDRPWAVSDMMNEQSPYVTVGATVRDAIDAMRATETSGVPIVDPDRTIVGFVSDGDVLKYLSRQSGQYTDGTNFFTVMESESFLDRLHDLLDLDVMRIATKNVVSFDVADDSEDVFKTLAEKRIKKVPVTRDGKLVGCLSRRNVLNGLATAEAQLSLPADA